MLFEIIQQIFFLEIDIASVSPFCNFLIPHSEGIFVYLFSQLTGKSLIKKLESVQGGRNASQ